MDDKAFTKALLDAQPILTAFCKRLTRHKERAEDLLQDGNLKLWEKRALYTDNSFLGWCKTVIKNTYLNQVLVESRMKFTEDAFVNGYVEKMGEYHSDGTSHDAVMEGKYLSTPSNQEDYWLENKIHEAIATFPPHQSLLLQKKLQGMEYKQIAKALGIKENNAKQRYFNVVKELRALLISQGILEE